MPKHYDFSIDIASAFEQVADIVAFVKPEWSKNELNFKVFDNGFSNYLFGVFRENALSHDTVLVRVFGETTDLFTDRKRERRIIEELFENGLAQQLSATFENGNVYPYIPGRMLEIPDLTDRKITDLVAEKLAALHRVPVPNDLLTEKKKGTCFSTIERMIQLLPKSDLADNRDLSGILQNELSTLDLTSELAELEKIAESLEDDIVICHHDLYTNNIIITNDENINLIDFEFAGPDYAIVDIVSFSRGYANVFEPNADQYPTFQTLHRFLTVYLKIRFPDREISNDLIHEWILKVDELIRLPWLSGALHWCTQLYWSDRYLDHGQEWISYAVSNLREFKRLKESGLGLTTPSD